MGAPAGPADAVARLRLARSAQIGPVTYRQLVLRFGSAEAALDAVPQLAARGGRRDVRLASVADAERELAAITRKGARCLFVGTAAYPPLLSAIDTAPPMLIVSGDAGLLDRPTVAIVGARNASAAACRFAREIAFDLGEAGVTVISGLARGIDTAAHHGSLGSGTVGVVAGAINVFYPPENEGLQREIAAKGLLVAEQPPGTEPRARHFPYRNRIIAGLAQATVVVEAAPKSGSLITARLAAEFGREVLAVPGSPLDQRAQGCNLLIREGATLIQNAADVLEALRPIGTGLVREPPAAWAGAQMDNASDADRQRILDLLGPTPVSVDEIVRQSGLPAGVVQTVLLELELAGRLDRHAGGRASLAV
ncbi:DNA-processing protein DprA [Sphingomonas sp. ID0503]|uniref:DNA-processing protein DprA n=1 Tax=Sphingomonas sp. ID0503 TaxID=3399691 RepID=UPI003AFA02B1